MSALMVVVWTRASILVELMSGRHDGRMDWRTGVLEEDGRLERMGRMDAGMGSWANGRMDVRMG